ncbi:MAG TPA: lipid II flippase MurJ, partial [Sphingorhabdus sp.]|nr:lipid II flippase MurJ [Sphingorhabdus sp.]
MSLLRHTSTIAGFTIISRIFGFIRDILLARVLGAGLAGDAYQLAFTLPNTFRRLFAEGAFSGLAMLAMPGIVWLLASEFQSVPGKFDLAVFLSRVTFPYLFF